MPTTIRSRRSIRLHSYDYTQQGAYFITLVTHARAPLFGRIRDGVMIPNLLGQIVEEEWHRSAGVRPHFELDAFQLMPNHIHGIVWIIARDSTGAQPPTPPRAHSSAPLHLQRPPHSLGSFVAGFKSAVTARINTERNTPGTPIWQRNYHERIIRSQPQLDAIRVYIADNPRAWSEDPENPQLASRH